MTNDDAYRLGLLDAVGTDEHGPREDLGPLLFIAEETELAMEYTHGRAVGYQLLVEDE